jgi:uncharacterized protein
MDFRNTFEVPLPPAKTWHVLMDIPRIAPCVPGAELVEQIDDRNYRGKVAVKLGPVALTFAGTAYFEILDEAAQRARVKAQGADAKGRGAALATIDFELTPAPGGTAVNVTTELALSGAVAQYGRASGVIQAVANQLLAQFSQNLKNSLAEQPDATPSVDGLKPGEEILTKASFAPISGFTLIARIVWNALKGRFRR